MYSGRIAFQKPSSLGRLHSWPDRNGPNGRWNNSVRAVVPANNYLSVTNYPLQQPVRISNRVSVLLSHLLAAAAAAAE